MANSPTQNSPKPVSEEERRPAAAEPDHTLPENSQANLDSKLDHAIEETFPTSDPISVHVTKGGAIDYDQPDTSPSGSQGHERRGTDENVLDRVRDALSDVAGSASETAREAYNQGQRYVRQASERYPEAERYYQDSSRAVRQQVEAHPLLWLFVAGAVGYGLAWLIHGNGGNRGERVPDYARTRRGYTAHRDKREGS